MLIRLRLYYKALPCPSGEVDRRPWRSFPGRREARGRYLPTYRALCSPPSSSLRLPWRAMLRAYNTPKSREKEPVLLLRCFRPSRCYNRVCSCFYIHCISLWCFTFYVVQHPWTPGYIPGISLDVNNQWTSVPLKAYFWGVSVLLVG